MEFFYHPWYMAAGGALISSPILIHLINRMRFKRIRWAAMEFLLKSQKRNRRKLIVEQMILLLLRILLVLLAAFLVARFVYGAGSSRGSTHVVIVDDTLSLNDIDKEGGKDTIAYDTAIEQIKELARNAAQASSAQQMHVFLLSELSGSPLYEGRLNDRSVEDIDAKFAARQRKPSLLHVTPLLALQKGRQFLGDEKGEGQKILHFVSDFRDRDWATGPDADKLVEEVRGVLDSGINLSLIDVATPRRNDKSKTVDAHNNLTLLDLKADTRVAIEDADIEFTATLLNNGTAKTKTFVEVFINGEHDLTRDVMVEDIEPGKIREHKFTLRFARRARPGSDITEKDTVEERERKRRLEREQFNVRVIIGREEAGLNADNVRNMVIEVRKKVPTLVIDGNKPELRNVGGDLFHLQKFTVASGIYELEERTLADLEKIDLDLYPSIMLLNVGEVSEAAVKKLKAYVENGGSLCWFLGEEIKPEHYNGVLFKNGLFPVLLNDRPYDPVAAAGKIDPEDRKKERERLRQLDPQPKILFPQAAHPLVSRLSPFTFLFRFLSVNVYWQAQPRSRWDPDLRKTESLIVLPNASSIDKYKTRAVELSANAVSQTMKLADKEAEFKRYVGPVDNFSRKIRNALLGGELYKLGIALEELLTDPGVEKDPEKPNMVDLWKHPDMKALASEIREFRESVLYGDPLLISRQQGKGRTVALMTTAGTALRRGVGEDSVQWNNWGAGEEAMQQLYPIFLIDLQKYLISEGQAPNRLLGEEVRFALDANRYGPNFSYAFTRQPDIGGNERPDKIKPEVEKGQLIKTGNVYDFALKDIRKPGVYKVSLTLLGDGPEEDRQEIRAYAYNVDTAAESDLKRTSKDRLVPEQTAADAKRGKVTLRVAGDPYEDFKERMPDASESSLLYLFFILILVLEQAMAVHLSFNSAGKEQQSSGTAAATGQAVQAA